MLLSQHAIARFSKRTGRPLESAIHTLYAMVSRGTPMTADDVLLRFDMTIHPDAEEHPTSAVHFTDHKSKQECLALVRQGVVVTVLIVGHPESMSSSRKEKRVNGRICYDRVIRTLDGDVAYVASRGRRGYYAKERRHHGKDSDSRDDSVL